MDTHFDAQGGIVESKHLRGRERIIENRHLINFSIERSVYIVLVVADVAGAIPQRIIMGDRVDRGGEAISVIEIERGLARLDDRRREGPLIVRNDQP